VNTALPAGRAAAQNCKMSFTTRQRRAETDSSSWIIFRAIYRVAYHEGTCANPSATTVLKTYPSHLPLYGIVER
jgi:hypothetical protein